MPRLPVTIAAAAAFLACVLAGAGVSVGTAPAQAASALPTRSSAGSADPGGDAAAFLAGQLAAGGDVLDYPGTDQSDIGLTADAVLGMLAARSGRTQALRSAAAVEAGLDSYLGPGFAATELYAGPVAKATLMAASVGADPRDFGGRDLVADLAGLEGADGRLADRTAYTDSSNTFTQALGLMAQMRTTGTASPKAVDFLLAQQCTDGGLRMTPGAQPCVSDPDAAALAVAALVATGSHPGESGRALDFLASRQGSDGGLGGGIGASEVNANSTGLAAMAFRLGGRSAPALAAQRYLASVQLGCAAPVSVRGAIAYNRDSYDTLVAAGDQASASDQERRATAQAVLAFGPDTLLDSEVTAATEPTTTCDREPTTTSTSPDVSTTSTSSPTENSTSATTVTVSVTTTATVTVTREAPPGRSPTGPETTSAATPDTRASGSGTPTGTATPEPSTSTPQAGATASAPTSSATPPPTAATTAGAPATGGPDSGRASALGTAVGLALLGAGAGALILRRERKTP